MTTHHWFDNAMPFFRPFQLASITEARPVCIEQSLNFDMYVIRVHVMVKGHPIHVATNLSVNLYLFIGPVVHVEGSGDIILG
jgi:hypothetical protein